MKPINNETKTKMKKQNHCYLVTVKNSDGSFSEIRLEASDWQTAARLCVPAYTGDEGEPFRVIEYTLIQSWEFDSEVVAKFNEEVIANEGDDEERDGTLNDDANAALIKYYIHNFDGNLIGPDEGVIPFDAPEMRHLAYDFDSEAEAKEAHEELLGWGNGGVTNDDELNGGGAK